MKKWIYSTLVLSTFLFASCKTETANSITPNTNSIDSLLQLYPDSVNLLVYKAEQLSSDYKYYEALEFAAKAFRLDTNNLESRHIYASCLNNKENRSFAEVANAQRHFQYILKRDPKNVGVMVELATTFGFMQDFDSAFSQINEALKVDDKNRDAYVYKGTLYRSTGKIDLAKSSYETAIQMDPKYYEGYIFLASIYQNERNPVSLEYYKTAYELKPIDELLYAYAYALEDFGKIEEAKSYYRKLASSSNGNYGAVGNFHLGCVKQLREMEIDSAIYFYTVAVDLDKDYLEAYHNRGMCFEEKKDVQNAMFNYLEALKVDPEFELSKKAYERIRKR